MPTRNRYEVSRRFVFRNYLTRVIAASLWLLAPLLALWGLTPEAKHPITMIVSTACLIACAGMLGWALYRKTFRPAIVDRKDRPVWLWVYTYRWELGWVRDDPLLGPGITTLNGHRPFGDIRTFGPRPAAPEFFCQTIHSTNPGWYWMRVDDTWECGHVLDYDAKAGRRGTVLETPTFFGSVSDVKAWGQKLEPPQDPKGSFHEAAHV